MGSIEEPGQRSSQGEITGPQGWSFQRLLQRGPDSRALICKFP